MQAGLLVAGKWWARLAKRLAMAGFDKISGLLGYLQAPDFSLARVLSLLRSGVSLRKGPGIVKMMVYLANCLGSKGGTRVFAIAVPNL